MSDDLVAVWKGIAEGRSNIVQQAIDKMKAAEARIEALEAENARLRASADGWHRAMQIVATIIGLPEPDANFASKVRDAFDDLRSQLHDANGVADLAIKHRDAAESALAEAVEVMRPFGNLSQRYDDTVSDGWIPWTEFITDHEWPSELNCQAARAFVQQHEGKK